MLRKLWIAIIMLLVVCSLSGCGRKDKLKEEDMVSTKGMTQEVLA